MHYDRERLEKSSLGETDIVWQFMQPLSWVYFVALDCTIIGVDTGKLNVLTQVVPALIT